MPLQQRPIHLVLDFDGTLTTSDTLSALSSAAYDTNEGDDADKPQPPATPWSSIVDAYLADYNAHFSTQQAKDERKDLDAEKSYLNSYADVEKASAQRIRDERIFAHVGKKELTNAARARLADGKVELREGWVELVRRVRRINRGCFEGMRSVQGEGVDVVSVNFSRWWVWSVLRAAAEDDAAIDRLGIYANEISGGLGDAKTYTGEDELDAKAQEGEEEEEEVRPTGRDGEVRTSGDKVAVLQEIKEKLSSAVGEVTPLEIYVGDSTTDLECLVDANVGICIRDEEMSSGQRELADTLQRLSLDVRHISEYGNPFKEEEAHEARIWYAKDFKEIDTWLHMFFLMTPAQKSRAAQPT